MRDRCWVRCFIQVLSERVVWRPCPADGFILPGATVGCFHDRTVVPRRSEELTTRVGSHRMMTTLVCREVMNREALSVEMSSFADRALFVCSCIVQIVRATNFGVGWLLGSNGSGI